MKDTIFREYDIRGIVEIELPISNIYDLTNAILTYFLTHKPTIRTLAIAMDGRLHSPEIKDEVCRAINDCGINVLYLGLCPTPALYFALFTQNVDGGIMITASHNSKEYNGMKICLGTEPIWGMELQKIKKLYKEKKKPSGGKKRGIIIDQPIIPLYVKWLSNHFTHLYGMSLPVIIDCGNGTAGAVLPAIIDAMNWKNVELLYSTVDGTYPNHEADPTIIENMQELQKLILEKKNVLGIGLDGDCDRMAPMTCAGNLVPGDQLLAIFAQPIIEKNPECAIVFDIKSSQGLIELLEKWGAHPILSPSGHSIIKTMMQKNNALLGGELSCHFFFKDRYFGYDDGIYALLRLIEILTTRKKSLADLLSVFPKKFSSPELRLFCPDNAKKEVIKKLIDYFRTIADASITTIDGIHVLLPFGWGIVRSSNTQAALSMRFEANSLSNLKKVMHIFYEGLLPHLPSQSIKRFEQEMEKA